MFKIHYILFKNGWTKINLKLTLLFNLRLILTSKSEWTLNWLPNWLESEFENTTIWFGDPNCLSLATSLLLRGVTCSIFLHWIKLLYYNWMAKMYLWEELHTSEWCDPDVPWPPELLESAWTSRRQQWIDPF